MSLTYTNRRTVKETTDEHILALIARPATAEQGFRLLMGKYQERIYWHIRRMVITHEDADDVIQNAFVKVFRGLPKFKGNSALYTWIYRIATNEALTHMQKEKRRHTVPLDGADHDLTQQLKADAFFDGDEAEAKLIRAVDALPEKQKLVFNMRYHDDMPYAEISEVLGTSVGALKASYHHAMKKIEGFINQVEM